MFLCATPDAELARLLAGTPGADPPTPPAPSEEPALAAGLVRTPLPATLALFGLTAPAR